MSKTVFRYFYDFLDGQENWLNRMAAQGYQLKKCARMTYTFDKSKPKEYEYAVEYVGDKAYSEVKDYRRYLESMGYGTFAKNINLNFSYGKIRWRPYAKGKGQLATSPGGFNKEILIIEKRRDGTAFELHTDRCDKLSTYQAVRRAYSWAVLIILALFAMSFLPDVSSLSLTMLWVLRLILLLINILYIIPAMKYTSLISKLKAESKIYE